MKTLMQNVAKAVSRTLPKGTGFFVLAFNFNADPGAPAQYVSNAQRSNIIAAMKEFIERNEFANQQNN